MTRLGSAHIIRGNALALPLPDASVDLVVTSPPYFGLRSYQDDGQHYAGQLGSEPTPAEFIDALIAATREMVRVLKPAGSIFVNLGDKYAGGGGGNYGAGKSVKGREGAHTTNIHNRPAWLEAAGMRAKSLMLLPERYRIACVDQLGLIARAVIVWNKPNGLPESVTDRVRRSHEDWVHLTTQPRYYSAVDEIREEHARAWGGSPNGGGYYGSQLPPGAKDANLPYATPNPLGKLPGSVWTIPTQPLTVPSHVVIRNGRDEAFFYSLTDAWAYMRRAGAAGGRPSARRFVDHFAAYPMEWPRQLIRAFSPAGVCTVCGEGRRPVARQTDEAYAAERNRVRARQAGLTTGRETALIADGLLHGPGRTNSGGFSDISNGVVRPSYSITGYACACPEPTAPTRPSTILDPFGGTGTTALMAQALGRTGLTVDMSRNYCRLAAWRTTDPGQMAAALQVEKPKPRPVEQGVLELEL